MGSPKTNAARSEQQPANYSYVPLVGMAVNAVMATLKIAAGYLGDSWALVADGIESTSDIVTSLVVWGGLQIASRPANQQHPYGYGKAESLAGVAAALALLAAAAFIAMESIHEIQTPHNLPKPFTLIVLIVVVVAKEALARWVSWQNKAAGSTSLQGDAWHHRSDAITSLAAIIGISIALRGGPNYAQADDWAALVACAIITYSGLRLLFTAVRDVLDVSPSPMVERDIRELALGVPGVQGVEKCRIRKSGMQYFVEIHIEVDEHATIRAGHTIGGRVRRALRESPHRIADALVHIEPFVANKSA